MALIVDLPPLPAPAIVENAAAPARPGHFAEREELDAALKAGTREALQLYLDRHPKGVYRAEGEAALRKFDATTPAPRGP